VKVLVVEDGFEYTTALVRFLPMIDWHRAGTGLEAIAMVGRGGWDAVVLDMRFDRVADGDLLGDLDSLTLRFGDRGRARSHLQQHQGILVLGALRDAGCRLPALIVHDFGEDARRWQRICDTMGPVDQVDDLSQRATFEAKLSALVRSGLPA
jgi:hypothetical protein